MIVWQDTYPLTRAFLRIFLKIRKIDNTIQQMNLGLSEFRYSV